MQVPSSVSYARTKQLGAVAFRLDASHLCSDINTAHVRRLPTCVGANCELLRTSSVMVLPVRVFTKICILIWKCARSRRFCVLKKKTELKLTSREDRSNILARDSPWSPSKRPGLHLRCGDQSRWQFPSCGVRPTRRLGAQRSTVGTS